MRGMSVKRCDYCEKESDELYACIQCDDEICLDCAVMPNQFNLIEYTICESCQNERDRERVEDAEWCEMRTAAQEGRFYMVVHLHLKDPSTVTFEIRNRSQ